MNCRLVGEYPSKRVWILSAVAAAAGQVGVEVLVFHAPNDASG